MKKFVLTMLAVSMMVCCLVGCGKNETKDETSKNVEATESTVSEEDLVADAQKFAEEFLTAYDENDIEKLSEMATENVIGTMGVSEGKASMLRRTLLSDMEVEKDLNEDAIAAADDMAKRIVDMQVQGFEIESVEPEDNVVVVKAKIFHGPDADAIANIDLDTKFASLADDYTQENIDELAKIYNEDGEAALENALMNGIYPLLFDQIADELESIDLISYDAKMSLKILEEGGFTVTSISEVATETIAK